MTDEEYERMKDAWQVRRYVGQVTSLGLVASGVVSQHWEVEATLLFPGDIVTVGACATSADAGQYMRRLSDEFSWPIT